MIPERHKIYSSTRRGITKRRERNFTTVFLFFFFFFFFISSCRIEHVFPISRREGISQPQHVSIHGRYSLNWTIPIWPSAREYVPVSGSGVMPRMRSKCTSRCRWPLCNERKVCGKTSSRFRLSPVINAGIATFSCVCGSMAGSGLGETKYAILRGARDDEAVVEGGNIFFFFCCGFCGGWE